MVAAMTRTSTVISTGAADAPERRAPASTRRSLACSGERHLADLVEEERAAVGQLERALRVARRAGERAALVAEQLALEQRLGEGGAVDGDERPPCARRPAVEGARRRAPCRCRSRP